MISVPLRSLEEIVTNREIYLIDGVKSVAKWLVFPVIDIILNDSTNPYTKWNFNNASDLLRNAYPNDHRVIIHRPTMEPGVSYRILVVNPDSGAREFATELVRELSTKGYVDSHAEEHVLYEEKNIIR